MFIKTIFYLQEYCRTFEKEREVTFHKQLIQGEIIFHFAFPDKFWSEITNILKIELFISRFIHMSIHLVNSLPDRGKLLEYRLKTETIFPVTGYISIPNSRI